MVGVNRLSIFIAFVLLFIAFGLTKGAMPYISAPSNAVVDVGQYQSFTASIGGDAVGTYTYNITVATANSVSPAAGIYIPNYDAIGSAYTPVSQLANAIYLTQGQMFGANWNNANQIINTTQTMSTTDINTIIKMETYNGIRPVLSLGGSTQDGLTVANLCTNPNGQNALIANIVNALNGYTTEGNTLPFNGFLLDIEPNHYNWATACGGGGNAQGTTGLGLLSTFIGKLATNITAINSTYTFGMYIATADGNNASFNYKTFASNGVNYYDDQDGINSGGALLTLGKLNALANLVGGKGNVRAEECIEGVGNMCDSVAFAVGQAGNVIPAGYGVGYFTSTFLGLGTNGTQILNQVANQVLRNTFITHNMIAINSLQSNTFAYQITSADTFNALQKAKVRIIAGANTLISQYSSNYVVNSKLVDSWTAANNPVGPTGAQTLTATTDSGSGTSPYIYNILVYNSVGLVYNSLSAYTSATTNVVGYVQQTAWGSGTFTANVFITDSASSPVTTSNTLTYTVTGSSLSQPSLTLSNTFIDQGQGILFTASFTGGSEPYTYNYLVIAFNSQSSSNNIIANMLITSNAYTSNTWFWKPSSSLYIGNSLFEANVIITDSVATTANSVYNSLGYNGVPTVSISGSNMVTESGQYTTYTINVLHGTGPFTVELYNITGSKQVASNVIIQKGGTNTISFQTFSTTSGNIFQFNAIATDYGTSTNTAVQSSPVINTLSSGFNNPHGVAFSPNGTIAYIAQYSGSSVSVVNVVTNTVIGTIAGTFSNPLNIAFSALYNLAYITNFGSPYGTNVINTATATSINTITFASTHPSGVAFNPSGTLAYIIGLGVAEIYVVNPATNVIISGIFTGTSGFSNPVGVAFNPSGTLAYVANNGDNTIKAINVSGNSIANFISVGSGPEYIAFNQAGTLAYVTNQNANTVSVINVISNTVINTLTVGNTPTGISINPTTGLIYVVSSASNTVNVINPITNTIINTIAVGQNPYTIAFSPNGRIAYITNQNSNNASVLDPSYILVVNTAPTVPTLTLSNTLLDSGQYVTLTTATSGGIPPYTYNFINVTSGTPVGISGCNTASTTCTFQVSSPTQSNVFRFNVLVTDSFGGTSNSITNSITVNEPLAVSLNPNSNGFIVGNTEIMTATITPGQGSYTYNWAISNTAGFFANGLYAGNQYTQNQIKFTPLAAGMYNVNIIITDSASTRVTVSTANAVITVTNAVLIPVLNPTSAVISALQSQVFTGIWYNGPAPYTATLKTFASANCLVGGATFQTITGLAGTTTNFRPVTPLTTTYYCLFVTDGTGNILNSTPSQIAISGVTPVNITTGNFPLPSATANCILVPGPPNSVSCQGNDKNNVIVQWVVNIYNSSGFAGTHLINSTVETGNFFTYSNSPIYPSNPVSWVITASGNNIGTLSWQGSLALNTHTTSYYTPLDTILVVVFLLIGIAAGSQTTQQHKLSSTMFIEGMMIAFLYLVGLSSWLGIAINAALILFCVVIGVLGYTQENKTISGI